MQKLKYRLTFRRGTTHVATVDGYPVATDSITVEEAGEKVIQTEQFLEKITGLRVHIDQLA